MAENIEACPVCGERRFSLFKEVKDHFLTREIFLIQQCNSCNFRFVSPRPSADEIGKYYLSDEYISHDSSKVDLFSRIYKLARTVSIRSKYHIVRRYAGTGKMLDIGCGTGEFLHYCSMHGFEVEGVEPSEKARNYAKQVNNLSVCGKLAEITSAQKKYDCITLWHVLEHLHDLNGTLLQIRELLNPGGVVIAAVPNSGSWDAGKYGEYWAAFDVPRHLYHFVEQSMQNLAGKHGFAILNILPQKLDAFYVSLLSEKYLSGRRNYVKSFVNGLRSNFQAGRNHRGHSSQIFVFSVKKA
jgi:2-polyprenyl-3-methyl-5-hydroxy-6-metoxy-1,4-benzoquinol methylase